MIRIRDTITNPRSFAPAQCHEITTAAFLIGTAIAALFGGGFSLWGSHKNRKAQRRINEQQMLFAREQMAWEEQQSEISRTWQEKMFDKENEYNDPRNVMSRASAAGLNPFGVFDQGHNIAEAGNVPSASGSGVSSPGVPSLQAPTYDEFSSFSDSIDKISGAISNIASADLKGTQKKEILDKLKPMIDNLTADTANKTAQSIGQKIQNGLQQEWGSKTLDKQFQVLAQQIMESQSREDLNTANKILSTAQAELASAKKETEVQMRSYSVELARENVSYVKQKIKESKSQVTSNYASAGASRALAKKLYAEAKTEDEKRDLLTTGMRLDNMLKAVDYTVNASTEQEKIKQIEEEVKQCEYLTYKQKREFESYLRDKDWQHVNMVLDQIHKTIRDIQGFMWLDKYE